MTLKNQGLALYCVFGGETCHEKKNLIQFKTAGNLAFFSNRKSVRLRMRS